MEQQHNIPGLNLELVADITPWTEWEKQPIDSFERTVQSGLRGFNKGSSGGLKSLDRLLKGIQKSRYYLIGADSGCFKTTFVDFYFVLCAWLDARKHNKAVKIFYISLEIGLIEKKAKWCAFYIGWKHNVNMSSDYILGRDVKLPTGEDLKLIQEAYAFVNLLMKDVIIVSSGTHPTAIFSSLVDFYEKHGTVYRKPQSDEDRKKNKKGIVTGFDPKPNLPDTYLVIDHLKLLDHESGLDTKGTMDRMSRHCVTLRNIFGLTPILIQQFNTDLMASRREAISRRGPKDSGNVITPQKLDFGESRSTYQDAEVVIGLVKPMKFELPEYFGFNCQPTQDGGFGEYFLVLFVMKNRYGAADRKIPLFVNPVSGIFYDLPLGFDQEQEWYDYAKKLKQEWPT